MNLRRWHRQLACSGLTGWKPVPLCSPRPGSWPQLTSNFSRCSLPMNRTHNSLEMNETIEKGSWAVSRSERNTELSMNPDRARSQIHSGHEP